MAHGEGLANIRYDRNCRTANVQESDRLTAGDEVELSNPYLRHATDILLEFGVLMIWWLWLKHEPNSCTRAYEVINSVTYDLILEKRYQLSSRILTSALNRNSQDAPELVRRMMAVNLANCLKKVEDDKAFEDALSKFDWSASADQFKISVASLNEDFDEVCALMPRVKETNVVGMNGLREWPVFDWVRDNDKVKEKFKEVFGEPLDIASTTQERPKDQGTMPPP